MQLVINSYGAYLRKVGELFLVKVDDKESQVSCRKVDSIIISTSAFVSSDALKMAVENNIDVIFLDEFGDPYGRLWHCRLGSTVLIRRRQLEISSSAEGLALVKNWITRKIDNQLNFVQKLKKTRQEKATKLNDVIASLSGILPKFADLSGGVDDLRSSIMGFEGAAGRAYFDAISYVMPEKFRFNGRSRNPAVDGFNAMLNYAYGILYSMVEKGCIIAGLDPYVGFLHADNYNKKSLVFDVIENFRIYADETVVYLFTGRLVKPEYFDAVKGGLTLNKEGKHLLIDSFTKFLDESIRYRGRNVKRRNTIQLECHSIASSLIKDVDGEASDDEQMEV